MGGLHREVYVYSTGRCTLPTCLPSEISKATISTGASRLRPRSDFHANLRKVSRWKRNCTIQKEKPFSKSRFDRLFAPVTL
jgi:hypothetical protein